MFVQEGYIHKNKMKNLYLSTRFMNTWSIIASILHNFFFFAGFLFREKTKDEEEDERVSVLLLLLVWSSGNRRFSQKEMDVEEEENERPISTSYFSGSQQVLLLHLAPKKGCPYSICFQPFAVVCGLKFCFLFSFCDLYLMRSFLQKYLNCWDFWVYIENVKFQ